MLIFFRVIQGATGGALQPLSQAVMLEAFPPQDRGKAMAFWGLGIVVAPMLGPVIGGYLTDNFSWRWVFYINLPVGLASVIMTRLFIFDPPYIRRAEARHRLLGHRHARRSASARCRSCSIRGRRKIGSPPTGSSCRLISLLSRWSLFMVHELIRAIPWSTCACSKTAPMPQVSS